MKIKSIELKNFRRYKDEIVEFPDGLIGIVGRNGVGKTTLIEALAWCLYGADVARTKQEEIKRSTASTRDECKVSIELVLDSDLIRIERKLTGKNVTPSANLYLNENPNAHVSGTKAVTKYISNRTRMDHIAFITSIFAKQKDLDRLSDMTGGQRKKTILRLLRIDQIEDAIKLLKDDIKENNKEIEHIQKTLKEQNNLEEELVQLKEKLSKTNNLINKTTDDVNSLQKSLKVQEDKFSTLEKKHAQHQEVEKKIEGAEGFKSGKLQEKNGIEADLTLSLDAEKTLNKLKPKLLEFEKIKKEKDELNSLKIQHTQKSSFEDRLTNCEVNIQNRLKIKKEFETKIQNYSNSDAKHDLIINELKILEKNLEDKKSRESEIQSVIYEKTSRKTEYENELKDIKKLGDESVCPKCKRPLGDTISKLLARFKTDIDKLQREINSFSSQKNALSKEIQLIIAEINLKNQEDTEIKNQIQVRNNLQAKMEEVNKTLNSDKAEKSKIENELKKFSGINYDENIHSQIITKFKKLETVHNNSIQLNEHVKKIPTLKDRINSIEKTIIKLTNDLKNYKIKLSQIGFDEKIYQKTKQTKSDIEQQYHQQREKMVEQKQVFIQIDVRITQQEITINEEKEKRKIIEDINSKIQTQKRLEKLMSAFKSDLIIRVKPQLSSRTSELFRQMTNGRYPSVELDDDFAIKIYDEGMSHPIQRFSGGETDLVNLCLRIAISEELSHRSGGSGTQFIVLDEIFGSQDEERKDNILRALHKLTSQFRQILLITHVEDVKDSLPYVLNVKENSDNTVSIEEEGNLPLYSN